RSAWADSGHGTPARGTRMIARNTPIFTARPIRARRPGGADAALAGARSAWSVGAFLRGFMIFPPCGSRFERAAPVGDGYPSPSVHAGEGDAVQTLMPIRREIQRRADAQVEIPNRLERLPHVGPGRMWSGPAQGLHDDAGVHEAF